MTFWFRKSRETSNKISEKCKRLHFERSMSVYLSNFVRCGYISRLKTHLSCKLSCWDHNSLYYHSFFKGNKSKLPQVIIGIYCERVISFFVKLFHIFNKVQTVLFTTFVVDIIETPTTNYHCVLSKSGLWKNNNERVCFAWESGGEIRSVDVHIFNFTGTSNGSSEFVTFSSEIVSNAVLENIYYF